MKWTSVFQCFSSSSLKQTWQHYHASESSHKDANNSEIFMNHNRSFYEHKYLSHAKRRPLSPSNWDFLVILHLSNMFLLPFGIRKILHLKCGKSEFLHVFTGLFRTKNVMVCILPRLLKKKQTLKLSYWGQTLKP